MTELTIELLSSTLDRAAEQLLTASGDDAIISRRDIRKKLTEMEGPERHFLDILYRYTDALDDKPRARVTRKDVERAVRVIKWDLLESGDIDLDTLGLSFYEVELISQYGPWALFLLVHLKRLAVQEIALTGQKLADELESEAWRLTIYNFASEGEAGLQAFYREASLERLTRDAFKEVIQLDQYEPPFNSLALFTEMDTYFIYEFLYYYDYGFAQDAEKAKQGRKLIATMEATLRDVHLAILGAGGDFSSHPTFWVGIDRAGNLVGLETETIWT